MTTIVIRPPSARVQSAVDEVLSAVIAAGGEYRGWTVDDMVADVLGESDPQLNDAVTCVIRRDHGRAVK